MLRLRVLYWKRGWRASQVTPVITKDDDGEVTITVTVQEGPPTVVGTMDIGALDTLLSGRDRKSMVALKPGDPLDLIQLDSIAVRIATQLDSRGYGDVTLNPVAVVDTSSSQGCRDARGEQAVQDGHRLGCAWRAPSDTIHDSSPTRWG